MDARTALSVIGDFVNEADSFVQTFDHEDHGDDEPTDEGCRFNTWPVGEEPFGVLQELIEAAGSIVDAENDIRTGNVAAAWPYDIAALAAVLGRKLEPHPDFGDEDE